MERFTLIILAATVAVSLIGFQNAKFFDRYKFSTYAILDLRQWDRILTSGFLHANWTHLLFNMLTFYFFAPYLVSGIGPTLMLLIFFLSILGGNVLSLLVHRRDLTYTAVGASGGVMGILYAAIALNPHIGIMIMFIPIPIPGWIFAIIYLVFSLYGMKNSVGNIGHTAHLGGALVGFVIALIARPQVFFDNILVVSLIFIPLIVFAIMVYKRR